MFKNDYVERLWNKDYIWAEVVKDIIERLIAMYSDFYADEKQEDKIKIIDIISQLQEKLKQEWDKLDKRLITKIMD